MNGFLFDTNIPSEMLRPRPDNNVTAWVQRQAIETVFVSVITLGELRKGTTLLLGQTDRQKKLQQLIEEKIPAWFEERVLPISATIAERWGRLDGERQLAGHPLNVADGLIAATALEHGLIVVTRNVKDFAGLGVAVLNPWEAQA